MFHSPLFPRLSLLSSSSLPPVLDTETGVPSRSVTASEQVASKPTPFTWDGSILDSERIFCEHFAKADQMSVVDCSKIRWSVGDLWVLVASTGSSAGVFCNYLDSVACDLPECSAIKRPLASTRQALPDPVPLNPCQLLIKAAPLVLLACRLVGGGDTHTSNPI